jgi:hypothetical protein
MGALGLAHATAIYKPNLLIKFTADSTFPTFPASYFDKDSALQLAILVVTTDADRARRGPTCAPSRCNSARPIPPCNHSLCRFNGLPPKPRSLIPSLASLVDWSLDWRAHWAGARGCGLWNALFYLGKLPRSGEIAGDWRETMLYNLMVTGA